MIPLPFSVLIASLAALFGVAPANECLKYEPVLVTLEGRLIERAFAGPPNYEDTLKGDRPEHALILVLSRAVCVQADTLDPSHQEERGIEELQVGWLNDGAMKDLHRSVGRKVVLRGELMHAISGHHHTKLLVMAQRVGATSAQSASRADSTRVDFTGDGVPESWIADTVAIHSDSLRITTSIMASGRVLFSEVVSVARPADRAQVGRMVRLDRHRLFQLDSLPDKAWSVDEAWYEQARRLLIEQERLDSLTTQAVIRELKRGTRVVLQTTVGQDASVFRAWSNRLGRFVVIGKCC